MNVSHCETIAVVTTIPMQQIPWGNHFSPEILLNSFLHNQRELLAIFPSDFSDTSSLHDL